MKNKDYTKIICVLLAIACVVLLIINSKIRTVPSLKDGEEILAEIDGKQFTAADIYAKMKDNYGTSALVNLIDEYIYNLEITDEEAAKEYAEGQLATIKAQLEAYGQDFNEALESAGYENEDELLNDIIKEYKSEQTAIKYIKETLTDKEIKNYYNDNIEGTMDVRYILIKPEVSDGMTEEQQAEAENKALEEAKEVIKKLKDGEDFADLAKEYSDDSTTASNGGLYEGFAKDEVVEEFWNAAYALKDKKYTTTPVESSYGYFVIYRIKQNDKPALEDCEEEIRETLANEKMTNDSDLTNKAWFEIRKKYGLNIFDTDIKDKYEKTEKSINE